MFSFDIAVNSVNKQLFTPTISSHQAKDWWLSVAPWHVSKAPEAGQQQCHKEMFAL